MIPVPPDHRAPRDVPSLPAYWDNRRRLQGKPDMSTCAADLRQALESWPDPVPWWQHAIIALAIMVVVWSGRRLWVVSERTPPAVMHCICPDVPCR